MALVAIVVLAAQLSASASTTDAAALDSYVIQAGARFQRVGPLVIRGGETFAAAIDALGEPSAVICDWMIGG